MSSEKIGQMLNDALQRFQAGAFADAERIYREILASNPETPDAWNNLALICYRDGRLGEAMKAVERALRLRSQIPPYWLTHGNIASALDRDQDALASFSRAIELAPGFAEAHYRRALVYHRTGRIDSAIAGYRQAARYAPQVAEIHFQLAEALMLETRWGEAMLAYEAAFKLDEKKEFDRRGSIDCLRYLQFETVPEFWIAEITQFFARSDIEKIHYSTVIARVLMTGNAFRVLLEPALRPGGRFEPDATALDQVMREELFRILLRDALVIDAGLEIFLTRLRAGLLLNDVWRERAPLDFLCALALQCFNNEFNFAENRDETACVDSILHQIEAELNSAEDLPDTALHRLVVLAMYRPLHTIGGSGRLAARRSNPPALEELLQRSVLDVQTEHALKQDIGVIGSITDGVSREVRSMYEEHPYPRWFSLDRLPPVGLADWLARETSIKHLPTELPAAPRILVAGCGTGIDAILLSTGIAGAQVLAVDLSLSSLAYARRKAGDLGVRNIEFRHGDILELDVLAERFDVVWSTGVLHHMRDPLAGLRVLRQLMRPGGLFKIGLYSSAARKSVNAAREQIRRQNLPATAAAIREFRQAIFDSPDESPMRPLLKFRDFYAMSTCRDLLFHVQEHQFNLPQIATILRDHGLVVLGLSDLPPHAAAAYRQMFPADEGANDLANWGAFETLHPDTFVGMYQIWCSASGGPGATTD